TGRAKSDIGGWKLEERWLPKFAGRVPGCPRPHRRHLMFAFDHPHVPGQFIEREDQAVRRHGYFYESRPDVQQRTPGRVKMIDRPGITPRGLRVWIQSLRP